MKCANCNSDALYTYKVSEAYSIHYCQKHLPRFLFTQKNAGNLKLERPVVAPEPVVGAVSASVGAAPTGE